MDYNRIAQIFSQKVQAEYKEDVAAIVLYQTAAQQENQTVRIYFIPKTDRGEKLGWSFLIKDTAIKILPYTWDALKALTSGDRRNVGMLTEAQLVYVCSKEDAARFTALSEQAAVVQNREEQCANILQECKDLYFSFDVPNCDAAKVFIEIFEKIVCALMLYNGKSFRHGWDTIKQDMSELETLPECYGECVDIVTHTADPQMLKSACCKLILQTQQVIKLEEQEEAVSISEGFAGLYESAKELYQRIITAAFAGNALSALLYAKELQWQLDQVGERTKQRVPLENLLDLYYRKDLTSFAVAMYAHEAGLMGFILNHGIQFEQYANIERFEEAMLPKD